MRARWVLLGLTTTTALATAAEPQEPGDVVLGAGLALGSFRQGDQAPPLCCGERDSWSTYGPELRLGFGYRVLPWLEPGIDFGAGRFAGSRGDVDIALTKLDVAPRVAFPLGDPLFVAPRIGWQIAHVSADFDAPGFTAAESATFMGPGVGVLAGHRLSRELAIGADAGYALISANAELSSTWHIGARMSWSP